MALLIGPLGILSSPDTLGPWTWVANPLLLAAWICTFLRRRVLALPPAIAALGLACSFLSAKTIMMNEGGAHYPIERAGNAYWLWLASMAIAIAAAAFAARSEPPPLPVSQNRSI